MPDQASLSLLGDDTGGIGYTLLNETDDETGIDTPRRGVREVIVLALLFVVAVVSAVMSVVYSANPTALAALIPIAVVFALAFIGVAVRYAISLRASAAHTEDQQRDASPERSQQPAQAHQPTQEVAQQPRSTPEEVPHRGETASDADVAPASSGTVSQPTPTTPSGAEHTSSLGAGAESVRSRSASQSAASSPMADVAPASSGTVSQSTPTTPSGAEHTSSLGAGAESVRPRGASQSAASSPMADVAPARSGTVSQSTPTTPSGVEHVSSLRASVESVRPKSASQPAASSSRAGAVPAGGQRRDTLHQPTHEVARRLRMAMKAAYPRDDIYFQEEDVAFAAGFSADADCAFMRLSPVERSSLRANEEAARILRMLDSGQAIGTPQLFHCDNKLHILARNGAIFRVDSASIVPAECLDSTESLGDSWMLLRPQLPEGQRIVGLARKVDTRCGEVQFPRDMCYAVAHCGALADTIKKVMLDHSSAALPESPESRMQIFRQYVVLHYNFASESAKTRERQLPLEDVRSFMRSPAGAGFTRDLFEYRASFQTAVEQDRHMRPECRAFLNCALSVLDSLGQEEIFRSDGVSQEVMCLLYSLSGATYLVKSDHDIMPAGMNEFTKGLTAKFLADENFRGALINLIVREVAEVVLKEQLPDQKTNRSNKTNMPRLDGVLAHISSRQGALWMCRAIPGLVQSVTTAVLGFCGVRDANHLNVVSPRIVSQLHVIPGFDEVATGNRLAEEGARVSARYEQLCADTARSAEIRPLIVAAAAAEAMQRPEMGQGDADAWDKEDCFALVTEKYRNSPDLADATARATTARSIISALTRDAVEEVVAHTTASWIEQQFAGDMARHYLDVIVQGKPGVGEHLARWLRNDALHQEPVFASAFSTEIRGAVFHTQEVDVLAMSEGLQPVFGDLLAPQFSVEDSQTAAERASSSSAETERSSPSHSEGAVDQTALPQQANIAPALNAGTSDFPAVSRIGDEGNAIGDASSNCVLFFLRPAGDEKIKGNDDVVRYVNGVRNSGGTSDAPHIFGVDGSFYIVGCDGSLFELASINTLHTGYGANTTAIPDGVSWVLVRTDCTAIEDGLHVASHPHLTLKVENNYKFPSDLRHSVAHTDSIEVVLKKLMLQLANTNSIESLSLRRSCLHHYVRLQRALISNIFGTEGGAAEERTGAPTEETLRRFMLFSDIGNGFARDLLDHQEELEAILSDELLLTQADRDFFASVLATAQKNSAEIPLDDPGVPLETMCGIYALAGGALLLQNDVTQDARVRVGHSELLCNFLGDPGFRDTLIALTVRGVIATINEVKRERPDLEDPKAFSDEVLRTVYSATRSSTLPMICKSIPGLVESAIAVLARFYNLQGAETKVASHGLLAHMHVIPGFGMADLGRAEAGRGRQIAQQCKILQERGASVKHALPVIVARAAMRGESMEGYLNEVLAAYERGEEKISNVTECMVQLRKCMPTLESSTLRELVYNAFATGVASMLDNDPQNYSKQAFSGIARGADTLVGELLARRALELPENLCFSKLMGQRLSMCIEVDSEVLGVSSDLYPAFRSVLKTQLPGDSDTRQQRTDSAQSRDERSGSEINIAPEVMRKIAEREAARVTRNLRSTGADGGLHTGSLSTSLPGSLSDLSQSGVSQATPSGRDLHSAFSAGGDRTSMPGTSGVGKEGKVPLVELPQQPVATPVGATQAQKHLAEQDSRSASPTHTNSSVEEGEGDETSMFFSANFEQPVVTPAGATQAQEHLAAQDSRSASPTHTNSSVAEGEGDETGMFITANFERPVVTPAGATQAQEHLAAQGLHAQGSDGSFSADSLSTISGSLNSFLSGVTINHDRSRSQSPVGGSRTPVPGAAGNDGGEASMHPAELPQQPAMAPASYTPVQEDLAEEGFDTVDAASDPATELQQATAARVGGRSRRSSLSGESDVLRVSENVVYAGEETLRRHDSVADHRVVLILEEFDVNTLPNTHPVKAGMLVAMGRGANDTAITFYQQPIAVREDGCDAHTFCVMHGKSFKVAPDVRVAPPGRSIGTLLSEIPSSPTSTKVVVKVPIVTGGLSLSDGKLNFQRAEFDISDLSLPAARRIDRNSLMSLMLNDYVACTLNGNLLGGGTFIAYLGLQQQLCSDFVTHRQDRGEAMIIPNQEWSRFICSPMGSKFVNDVKRYMSGFRDAHNVMPDSDNKTRLQSVMTSISHNVVSADGDGTSVEVLKALHALSHAGYQVDCTSVGAEERTKAIVRKFLADDEFGMALIMAAMSSCLDALVVHFSRSSRLGGPADDGASVRGMLNSVVPDICRRIPGLTEGMVGLLQRVVGVNRVNIDQHGRQTAIVTSIEKWVDGSHTNSEQTIYGCSLDEYLANADASYMRNAIVACAQAKAAQRGGASNRQGYYSEVMQEFLGSGNVPSVEECEERIGTAIAGFDENMLAGLVADSVAHRVYKNLVCSPGLVFDCEERLIRAFYGHFSNNERPQGGAVQFARDLSAHSKNVISKFLAAEKETVREFLPSIMNSHSDVSFFTRNTRCEVFICEPAQSARSATPHTRNHELTGEEQGVGAAQHLR